MQFCRVTPPKALDFGNSLNSTVKRVPLPLYTRSYSGTSKNLGSTLVTASSVSLMKKREHSLQRKTVLLLSVTVFATLVVFVWTRNDPRQPIRWPNPRPSTAAIAAAGQDSKSFVPVSSRLSDLPKVDLNFSVLCDKWGVVAPVDLKWASEAVRRQTRLQDWCLVVVFDSKPLPSYDPLWYEGRGNKVIVYLTRDEARNLNELAALRNIPWNTVVGRKVVGYLYAIAHGARVVWDFNDYNMLKFWIPDAAPPGAPSLEATIPTKEIVTVREIRGHSWPTFNPHPAFLPPVKSSWPRGLPLDDALREECSRGEQNKVEVKSNSIAVLHSLSDRQPDADIILQSTMPLPFYFKRTAETNPLLVPPQTFSPYNARSTLHLQPGLWAMYLPQTVDEELSDIWRGYIAQRLFWEVGLRMGFTARPLVVQDHDIRFTRALAQSQLHASNRTKELITFLGSWRGKGETFIQRVDELWIELYRQSFIKFEDVESIHLWLLGLQSVNYTFPNLIPANVSSSTYLTGSNAIWKVPSFPDNDTERYTTDRNKLEYSDEVCHTNAPSLTFWNSDTHYGSRLDMASYLGSLGHNIYESVGTRQNYHPSVWNMPGVHLYDRVSNVIKKDYPDWTGMNSRLKESMIKENFEFYKNDTTFRSVDAFYCLFPAALCEMWMPFNKTTIVMPAHRYSIGRCTKKEFDRLNEHLRMLASMEHPKHIMAASSKYDMEYLRHYTGVRDVLPLYAHTATYIGDTVYNPSRDEIIMFLCKWNPGFFWDNRFVTEIKKFKIVDERKLYKNFLFSNFVKHRAVVYLPYAVMSYKISELYTMGIPMFFPSMKYLQNIKPIGDDRTVLARYYCAHTRLGLKDSDMVAHPNSIHPYSPNLQENVDKESEYYWLQLADFFQWPHLTYFDDFKDLERKLEEADFNKIHELMMKENERRSKEFSNNWCKVLNKIEKGRVTPQVYESAIRDLYGLSRLQVY